jgi:hypothetical protein
VGHLLHADLLFQGAQGQGLDGRLELAVAPRPGLVAQGIEGGGGKAAGGHLAGFDEVQQDLAGDLGDLVADLTQGRRCQRDLEQAGQHTLLPAVLGQLLGAVLGGHHQGLPVALQAVHGKDEVLLLGARQVDQLGHVEQAVARAFQYVEFDGHGGQGQIQPRRADALQAARAQFGQAARPHPQQDDARLVGHLLETLAQIAQGRRAGEGSQTQGAGRVGRA